MAKRKGSGTVVCIKGRYYPRWTINGERVYGEPHETWEAADLERASDKPDEKPAVAKSEIPTLADWTKRCLEGDYGKGIALTTFNVVESIYGKHVEPSALGKTRLHRLTGPAFKSFFREMRKWNSNEPVSPWHRNRAHSFLSAILGLAVEAGYLKANPLKGIKLAEVEERENRTLSPEEALLLLNPQTRVDAMMLVAMHTGMRNSELRRLEWRHIGDDTIKIPGTKSQKSKAVLPLTPEALAAITAQPKRSIFVFTEDDGGPVRPRRFADDIQERKAALGLPKETRLHDLRGSYISLLIENGVDPKTVMELARHADLRTTMKMYARSREQVQKQAVETLRLAIVPKQKTEEDETENQAMG
ncbi:MAG TPA: site-specific integrase [Fimbriimonas sp.]|nr:site-specific integrase [Fimbriimonas sp.]